MAANDKRILTSRQEVMDYLGITKHIYLKFIRLGMPVLYMDGRCYAHKENLDTFLKAVTSRSARDIPDEVLNADD